MKELNQNDWKAQQEREEQSIILDVRTQGEYDEGFIPGAKLIDIREPQAFMSQIEKLDKTKPYFLYCRSGARSAQACQVMEQLGFEKTNNLVGGITDWKGEKQQS